MLKCLAYKEHRNYIRVPGTCKRFHNINLSVYSRFKKRPGVDQFLQTVANSDYEVVIFTSENVFMIWPVLDKLDPENKLISYRLFRDSTHFIDGVHIKNLEGLNRDLSKVSFYGYNVYKFQHLDLEVSESHE